MQGQALGTKGPLFSPSLKIVLTSEVRKKHLRSYSSMKHSKKAAWQETITVLRERGREGGACCVSIDGLTLSSLFCGLSFPNDATTQRTDDDDAYNNSVRIFPLPCYVGVEMQLSTRVCFKEHNHNLSQEAGGLSKGLQRVFSTLSQGF